MRTTRCCEGGGGLTGGERPHLMPMAKGRALRPCCPAHQRSGVLLRRNVTVDGAYKLIPGTTTPYPCHRTVCPSNVTVLLPGETLDVRLVVDRPIVEVRRVHALVGLAYHPLAGSFTGTLRHQVFVLGGRIAWAMGDGRFNASRAAVHVYNHGTTPVVASNVSVYGMGCGWAAKLPVPK